MNVTLSDAQFQKLLEAVRPAEPRKLYSIPDAARQLSISNSTFYETVLPFLDGVVRHGRRTLIPAASLDAWIAKKTARPSEFGAGR